MSDEEINTAIAVVMGWDMDPAEAHGWESRGAWCKSPSGTMKFKHAIPSYTTDLNAIHEAEKHIMELSLWVDYTDHLGMSSIAPDRRVVHATARQRAEKFLRTLNLWKEGE